MFAYGKVDLSTNIQRSYLWNLLTVKHGTATSGMVLVFHQPTSSRKSLCYAGLDSFWLVGILDLNPPPPTEFLSSLSAFYWFIHFSFNL